MVRAAIASITITYGEAPCDVYFKGEGLLPK